MTDFKKYLQFLPPKDYIYGVNFMIDDFNTSNRKGEILIKKFRILNELRTKRETVLNTYIMNNNVVILINYYSDYLFLLINTATIIEIIYF